MRESAKGIFIDDAEIRERYGDKAEQIIAALDADPRTQKDKATRPKGTRYRPAVEEFLAAIPKDEPTADESQ